MAAPRACTHHQRHPYTDKISELVRHQNWGVRELGKSFWYSKQSGHAIAQTASKD